MQEAAMIQFLTHLAVDRKVTASTQNHALSTLLFLYSEVLKGDLNRLGDIERARKPSRLPVVLTQDEVIPALNHISGEEWMMASLLYGAGLRLMDAYD